MRPVKLLAYSATELPIGRGCLYACTIQLSGVTGVVYARLSADGTFSLAKRFQASAAAQASKWYSPELVRALVASKRSAVVLSEQIAEAVHAAVSARDRRVGRPRPFVRCINDQTQTQTQVSQDDETEQSGDDRDSDRQGTGG